MALTRNGHRRCWADMCSDSDDEAGIEDLIRLSRMHSGSIVSQPNASQSPGPTPIARSRPMQNWTPRLPETMTNSPRTECVDYGGHGRWSKRKWNAGEKKAWRARQSTQSTIDSFAPSSPAWTETETAWCGTETDGSNSAGSSSRAVVNSTRSRKVEKEVASLQKQVATMKKDAQKTRITFNETRDALQKVIDEERSRNVDQNTRLLLEMDQAAQILEQTKTQFSTDKESWQAENQRLVEEIKAAELRVECEIVQNKNSQFEYECKARSDAAAKTREAIDGMRSRFEEETCELRENVNHYISKLKEARKDHNTYSQKMQGKLDSALARCLRAEKNAKKSGKEVATQTPEKSSNEERLQEVNRKVMQRLAEVSREKKDLLERLEFASFASQTKSKSREEIPYASIVLNIPRVKQAGPERVRALWLNEMTEI